MCELILVSLLHGVAVKYRWMCDDIFLMCEMYVSLALVNFVDVIVLYFSVMMSSKIYFSWFYIYVYYGWMINIHEDIKVLPLSKCSVLQREGLSNVNTLCAWWERAMTILIELSYRIVFVVEALLFWRNVDDKCWRCMTMNMTVHCCFNAVSWVDCCALLDDELWRYDDWWLMRRCMSTQ